MQLPQLRELRVTTDTIQAFGGYNHRERIGENEFYDMENLSSDQYPLMTSRKKRGTVLLSPSFTGRSIIGKNLIWYSNGGQLHAEDPLNNMNGAWIPDAELGYNTQFVSLGAYLVDMETKFWINTVSNGSTYEYGHFDYSIAREDGYFSAYICDEDGNYIMCDVGQVAPETEASYTHWLDISETPAVLYRYYSANKAWFPVDYYVRVTFDLYDYDQNPFQKGDMVRFDSPEVKYGKKACRLDTKEGTSYEVINTGTMENGNVYVIMKCGIWNATGFAITADGTPSIEDSVTGEITVSKKSFNVYNPIPVMDFVVEANNRLWGCRYGDDGNGNFVNEIYASKLGSFRVWEKFTGTSDDSYRVSCGTDNPFTGAITYAGNPIFFKEDAMHRVYGTYPFQVTPILCNGVQEGCSKSLAVVSNVLFYKSPDGICTYTGSYPSLLALPFGNERYYGVVAAGTETKYYFSASGYNGRVLFVYDTQTNLLTKEDDPNISEMITYDSEVYALISMSEQYEYQGGIICLSNEKVKNGAENSVVPWYGVFGAIGISLPQQKYVTELDVRMSMAADGKATIYFEYDSSGIWEKVHEVQAESLKTYNIPLRVKRCDHVRMKMEGTGSVIVYSITKTLEGGSTKCR